MRRTRRIRPQPPLTDAPDSVGAAEPDSAPDVPELARAPAPNRVSIRHRMPLVSLQINRGWLLSVIVLVVIGVGAFLAQRNALPRVIVTWWPALLILIAAIGLIRSLARRTGAGLLGSGALGGLGISLLLATAFQMPFGQTWVGTILITVGLAIVLGGFG